MKDITFEDLKKLADDLAEKYPPVKSPFGMFPLEMPPLKIIEEPKQPQKIKLSDHVMVSDEFRVNFNDWLNARFGRRKSDLPDGVFWVSKDYGIAVGNSKSIAMLKTIA